VVIIWIVLQLWFNVIWLIHAIYIILNIDIYFLGVQFIFVCFFDYCEYIAFSYWDSTTRSTKQEKDNMKELYRLFNRGQHWAVTSLSCTPQARWMLSTLMARRLRSWVKGASMGSQDSHLFLEPGAGHGRAGTRGQPDMPASGPSSWSSASCDGCPR